MAQRYFPEGDANHNEAQQALWFTLEKLIMVETESYGSSNIWLLSKKKKKRGRVRFWW